MSDIILITGNVKFTITLDPGVWIFDDRKIDLNTYFAKSSHDPLPNGKQEEKEEIRKLSAFWDREIQEGAVFPPTLKTEKRFLKEKLLQGHSRCRLLRFCKTLSRSRRQKNWLSSPSITK